MASVYILFSLKLNKFYVGRKYIMDLKNYPEMNIKLIGKFYKI